MKVDESLIIHNSLRRDEGTEAIRKLLTNPENFDAIFCANDTTALSAIIYFKMNGIRIPDDIMIVGFSNEPFSEVVSPSISTVKQPGFSMGQKAAELIIEQINGKKTPEQFETITMPTELIIRNSSVKND
jgi:LacI family transcriptional regulator